MKNLVRLFVAMAVVVSAAAAPAARAQPSATQPAKELILDLGNHMTLKVVLIPSGKFMMGSPLTEKGHEKDEIQHEVTISKPFFMGSTPVTQAQWKAVMGNIPSHHKGDDLPEDLVSRDDAMAFCKKLGAKIGKTCGLPTEAQWEYACRAGTTTPFYTGDDEKALAEAGWYRGNSGGKSHPVGQKKPNAWGLYDMHGNVWQWCQDRYGNYEKQPVTDPTGPKTADFCSVRGGSWDLDPSFCRSADRGSYHTDYRSNDNGFRVVVTAGGE